MSISLVFSSQIYPRSLKLRKPNSRGKKKTIPRKFTKQKRTFKKLPTDILRPKGKLHPLIHQATTGFFKIIKIKMGKQKIRVSINYDSQQRNTVDKMNIKMNKAQTGDPERSRWGKTENLISEKS